MAFRTDLGDLVIEQPIRAVLKTVAAQKKEAGNTDCAARSSVSAFGAQRFIAEGAVVLLGSDIFGQE